jgi:hypothetical protein
MNNILINSLPNVIARFGPSSWNIFITF